MRWSFIVVSAVLAVLAGPAWSQQAAEPQADPPAPAAAEANSGAIALELNKLMPAENVCQAYFVVNNRTPSALKELTVDAYLFDKEGVILRGLALQFTDVRSERTTVVPFELADLNCGDIGRILLNKVLTCIGEDESAVAGCADQLSVSTRAPIAFEY